MAAHEQHHRMPLLPARLVISGSWFLALPECVPARVASVVGTTQLHLLVEELCDRHGFGRLDCATLRSVCELSAAQSKPNLAALMQDFETLRDLAGPSHHATREERWSTILNVTANVRAHWQLGRGAPWDAGNASAFFAAREGRRVFLTRKGYLQHQDPSLALQEAWVDSQELDAWQKTMTERSIDLSGARGISAAPTMYGAQGSVWFATVTKLTHDAEQMAHLLLQGKLPPELWEATGDYLSVAKAHSAQVGGGLFQLDGDELIRLAPWVQTHMYHPPPPTSPLASAVSLQPSDDVRLDEITREYHARNMVVIDDFFSPEALRVLTDFVHEATIFYDVRPGYLGAYLQQGLDSPVLFQAIDELRQLFPDIIGDKRLKALWSYKIDGGVNQPALGVHGDEALVNLNVWLNPADEVGEEAGGGLQVWEEAAPTSWSFAEMNKCGSSRCRALLERSASVTIPYRRNRLVLFKSTLFHQSVGMRGFPATGYTRRRINLTFLFGDRPRGGSGSESRDEL
jgi:hypothetical protein